MPTFGPGTLKIGATGTEVDVSCLVNGVRIAATKDQGDATTKLCGTKKLPAADYSWEMSGSMDVDPEDPDGIFMLSATAYGTEQSYVFTPNTAAAVTATGKLIIDPLDFGADEFGADMTSDFTWALTDEPTYSPTIPAADAVTMTE
jgi:hypothetical protein